MKSEHFSVLYWLEASHGMKKKKRKWMSEHLIMKFFREAIGRQKLVDLHHSKAQVSVMS